MATKRKAASALTAAEQTAYQDTIGQLIQTGAYGSLVAIHGDMNHDQHGSMGPVGAERFLPWHRDFLVPGTAVSVDGHRAVVTALPFVDRF